MKKIIFLFILFFYGMFAAQENYEINTLGVGPYKIFMKAVDAEKISQRNLFVNNDTKEKNIVNYFGENIELQIQHIVLNENERDVKCVISASSKSKKFKTKEGLGVGNSKEEIIETYKVFSNFSFNQAWDYEKNSYSDTISEFNINNIETGTVLTFKIENNIVTEVVVNIH